MTINWKVVIIAASAAIVGMSSIYLFKMKPHNIVETESEKIIKDETGLNIDLDLEEDLSCCLDEPEETVKEA